MGVKSSIENLAHPIGFEIGASDDICQSNLLNGFCHGLAESIVEKHNLDLQVCYIVNKLDKKTSDVLLKIAEFITLKNQESL